MPTDTVEEDDDDSNPLIDMLGLLFLYLIPFDYLRLLSHHISLCDYLCVALSLRDCLFAAATVQ